VRVCSVHLMEENSLLVHKMHLSRHQERDSVVMSELLSSELKRSQVEDAECLQKQVVDMQTESLNPG
jgi:hypothetical protein